MIRLEPGTPGRVRVIGSLQGAAMNLVCEAISRGAVVLDLSEVDQADDSAVRLLAGLAPERCALVACPMWLRDVARARTPGVTLRRRTLPEAVT